MADEVEVEDGGESPKGTRPGYRQPASTPPKWTMASKPKMVIGGPVPSWQARLEERATAGDRRASRGHNTTTPRMPSRTGSRSIPCAASLRW